MEGDPVYQEFISRGDGSELTKGSDAQLAHSGFHWVVPPVPLFTTWLSFPLSCLAAAASSLHGCRSPLIIHCHAGSACLFVSTALSSFHSMRSLVSQECMSCLSCFHYSGPPLSCFLFDGLISHTFWLRALFKISRRYGCAIIVACDCQIIIFWMYSLHGFVM